jgi:HTH-type transcriptional regulator/antitoxin MqsA
MTMATNPHQPDTMLSPETGETLCRGVRPFIVTYKGGSISVELPGYYPDHADGGVHVGEDMDIVDAALRVLKRAEARA